VIQSSSCSGNSTVTPVIAAAIGALRWNDSRATERRGCAFLMSPQIYGILARAALVSCSVNARSVSVRTLPSDPTA